MRLKSLHFEFARLTHLAIRRRFDVVICLATLHYVENLRAVVKSLYSILKPGGFLILNYPILLQRAATAREAEREPIVLKRFALVLAGTNLLSRGMVEGDAR